MLPQLPILRARALEQYLCVEQGAAMALACSTAAQFLPAPSLLCRLQLPQAPRASDCLTLSSTASLTSRCLHVPSSNGLDPSFWAALVP